MRTFPSRVRLVALAVASVIWLALGFAGLGFLDGYVYIGLGAACLLSCAYHENKRRQSDTEPADGD
ncbi:hypothetical protein [Prauserella cavernicola]|uniref:DUF2530 domain-containing protein n=1 Tax=Prauserella cavernicola TaxID=2800127 RepID=A0A934QNT5_9PSEU|nr:hypothetical protein [Prauserella cavernicola]MBK1783920.1 hypothetical protein [Prauserella cavernicola]